MNQFKSIFWMAVLAGIISSGAIVAQTCEDGMAGEYPCSGINQYAFLSAEEIGGGIINDNWGWVSPETGKEYAIQARSSGTSFIDITDPYNPLFIGNLPPHNSVNPLHRDVKVYSDFAYIVSESNHGLQIFDLTQLDEVVNPPVEFIETAHSFLISSAHNIAINEASGFAYTVGGQTFAGGIHFIDLQNPTEPQTAGGFESDGYTHDLQVVYYNGLDENYVGQEIAFASNENSLTIIDVTDKSDPVMISRSEYDESSYTHQGWLTEDHRYFLMNDELDEFNFDVNTRTFVWDLLNLEEPELVGFFENETTSTDHNLYIVGDYCYQANYTSGLRVLKLNDLETLDIEEVAWFDVLPEHDSLGFAGAWNVYPFFPSGTLILSNMYEGFHVLQPDFDVTSGVEENAESALVCYPNPAEDFVRIQGVPETERSIEVFDITGKQVWSQPISRLTEIVEIDAAHFPGGLYLVKAGEKTTRLVLQ